MKAKAITIKRPLSIAAEDQAQLLKWVRSSRCEQRLALRARIVLASAQGGSHAAIGRKLGVSTHTVSKWVQRYRGRGLAGLQDLPRPGAPPRITDGQLADVMRRTLTTKPKSAPRWSSRGMARSVGLSQSTIVRIWNSFQIAPPQHSPPLASGHPVFVEQVCDIAGIYLDASLRAVVVAVNESVPVRNLHWCLPLPELDNVVPFMRRPSPVIVEVAGLLTRLGQAGRSDAAAEDPQALQPAFVEFIEAVRSRVPEHLRLHVVLENGDARRMTQLATWFAWEFPHRLHLTPLGETWDSQIVRLLSMISEKRLHHGIMRSLPSLCEAIQHALDHAEPASFHWRWITTATYPQPGEAAAPEPESSEL
jgi:Homeodomain-like domain